MKPQYFHRQPLLARPSAVGCTLGAVGFLASLTPSLIPRTGVMQGVIAGIAFIVAYGIGVGILAIYRWLGFSEPQSRTRRIANRSLFGIAVILIVAGLVNATDWQNATARAIGSDTTESARPLIIIFAALPITAMLLLLARLFKRCTLFVAEQLSRFVPAKVALLSGFAIAVVLAWSLGNGLLVRGVVRTLDGSYRELDQFIPPDAPAPDGVNKTGGPGSLIAWDSIGAAGRDHIMASPSQLEITTLSGQPSLEPLRVYVGLNSADDPHSRAKLALDEMLRIGAFERSWVVIATPTGTGWIDPAAAAPLEMLTRGDVASISVQYSYLPSWLTLFTEPEYGRETARAVFDVIYGHWRTLPKDQRPKLILFGLSLGALNSEQSFDFHDIVGAPFDGALWAGPPFASPIWQDITRSREPGSPAWLPVFRDSSLFHFQNQNSISTSDARPWGPMRFVYLQYASDPIVFLDTKSVWRRPEWLNAPRGPDVAPELHWIPVITFLQTAYDAMIATTTPPGSGHVYATEDYLAAWQSVIGREDWSEEELARVRRELRTAPLK